MDEVYWSHSFNDLKVMVSLRTQYEVASALQNYESFRLVASEALGGSKPSDSTNGIKPIESFAELAASFRNIGGSLGG